MVIMSEPCAVALLGLVAALAGVEFSSSTASVHQLELELATATPAQALLDLLLLAAMGALLTAAASIHHQLRRHRAAAGARTEVAFGFVCAAVGLLQFLLLRGDVTRRACALGPAAVLLLPTAATVSFFLSMALIFAHVHGGAVVVAEDGPLVQTPVSVWILTKLTLGAAAGVVVLMALAQYA